MPYILLTLIGLLTPAAALLARRLGQSKLWPFAFLTALALLTLVILGHRSPSLSYIPPISWAVDINIEPLLMALIIPLLLVPLMLRLPPHPTKTRRQQFALAALALITFIIYCIAPIAAPLFVQPALARAKTQFDKHGVCMQSFPYTCGPASAVTCLHALGIPADEGPLAIAARCGPIAGTDEPFLAATLSKNFNITAQSRYFPSLDSLTTPAIADTTLPNIGGHYIAVLNIAPAAITVGDPYNGYQKLTPTEFLAIWNHTAITFQPAR